MIARTSTQQKGRVNAHEVGNKNRFRMLLLSLHILIPLHKDTSPILPPPLKKKDLKRLLKSPEEFLCSQLKLSTRFKALLMSYGYQKLHRTVLHSSLLSQTLASSLFTGHAPGSSHLSFRYRPRQNTGVTLVKLGSYWQ